MFCAQAPKVLGAKYVSNSEWKRFTHIFCLFMVFQVAMADPLHYAETEAAVASVMEHFPNTPAVFFSESDEVRGMNRDSRSSRLGLSNAELLARDMNRLAAMVTTRNTHAMPIFWASLSHIYTFTRHTNSTPFFQNNSK